MHLVDRGAGAALTVDALLAGAGLASFVAAAVSLVALHLLPSDVDPIADGASAYALGSTRSLYWAQAAFSGVGGLCLAGALVLGGSTVVGPRLLATDGLARIAIIGFPTDRRDEALTPTGRRHALLAAVAFLAVAAAAPLATAELTAARPEAAGALAGLAAGVTITCLASFGAAVHPRTMAVYGLVQRAFYVTLFAWFIAAAALLAIG